MAQQRRKNVLGHIDSLTDLRVGVYNIFLTTDAELARNFSKYSSFSILKNDIERDKLDLARDMAYGDKDLAKYRLKSAEKRSLCLLSSDLNIVKFTHEFGFSETTSLAPKIEMECIEPGLEILKKIYYLLLGERMSEIKYRKSELQKQSQLLDGVAEEAFAEGGTLNVAGTLDQADIKLRDYLRSNTNGQRVYIAYGIGDDLKYWGGPYSCILGRLEHSNDGKTETITYHFSPDHVSRQFDERPLDIGSETVNFKTLSIPITAWKDDPVTGRQIMEFEGYTPSFHDNVVKLISNYLYELGIKNHLVVLPNLDYILSPLTQSLLKSSGLYEFKDAEANYDEYLSSVQGAKRYLYETAYQNQTIFGLNSGGTLNNTSSWWIGTKKMSAADIIQLQKDFLGKVGLRGNNIERESSDVNPKLINGWSYEESENSTIDTRQGTVQAVAGDEDPNILEEGLGTMLFGAGKIVGAIRNLEESLGTGIIFDEDTVERLNREARQAFASKRIPINDPFSSAKNTQVADAVISMELPFEADADAFGVERSELLREGNFINHIEKFVQQIINRNGGFIGRLSSFWENDVNVIDMFKEKFGSGTFVGYKDNTAINMARKSGSPDAPFVDNLTGGSLDISDDAFFIFGDEDLIRDFLYGEIVHKTTTNMSSRSVLTQLRRGVPLKLTDTPPNYFLDPFWNRIRNDLDSTFTKATPQELEQVEQTPRNVSKYKSELGFTFFSKIQRLVGNVTDFTPFGYFNDYNISTQRLTSMLPDEFGFLNKDENSGALSDIFELGIPFFLANTKNSNVLSYTFDADNFILAQFLGSINEIYYNAAYRYVKLGQQNPVLKGRMSSDAAFEKIYDVLNQVRQRGGDYGRRFKGLGLASPEVNLTKLSTDLVDIMLMETQGLNRKVRKNYGADTLAICHLFLSLFESQFKGIIKTLPMFHLSDYRTTLKPAIVYLRSTPGVNIQPQNDRSTADFFTGMYKILGFKHTISKNKGQSEFTLVKDIQSTLSNDS